MRTRRRTYTAERPASLFPEAPTDVQSCTANPRGNRGSKKKKKKCIRNWDLNIPSELLQEILSRLGLKANIQASTVCKTWFEAAVSVRKLQPRPWLFYPVVRGSEDGTYILVDTLRSQTYELNYLEMKKGHTFCYSRDGWLLVASYILVYFINPFTREHIYLPERPPSFIRFAFSAAPTSTSCFVISYTQPSFSTCVVIKTWRPGETVWTTHRFENQLPNLKWNKCVFSNGMFYFLSTRGHLGVFDPYKATWNILPVKPFPKDLARPVLMTEHEGDIFLLCTRRNNNLLVFKLNRKQMLWEEKRELGGLTVFASHPGCFARVGLSAEERNRIYQWHDIRFERTGMYHSLGGEKSSKSYMWYRITWVDPPHNNFHL